jgi:hypothetical protein
MSESEIISSFIKKENRDRVKTLLESKKGRKKFVATLAHNFIDKVEPSYIKQIYGSNNEIIDLVKNKLRNEKCFVISGLSEIDKKHVNLEEVLKIIIGYGMGTILYTSGGSQLYYEGEDNNERYIISKKAI